MNFNLKNLELENQDIAFISSKEKDIDFDIFYYNFLSNLRKNTGNKETVIINISPEESDIAENLEILLNKIKNRSFPSYNLVINYKDKEFISAELKEKLLNFMKVVKIQTEINFYFFVNVGEIKIYNDDFLNEIWSFSNVMYFKNNKIFHLELGNQVRTIDLEAHKLSDFVNVDSFFIPSKNGKFMSFQTHEELSLLNKISTKDTPSLVNQFLTIYFAESSFEHHVRDLSRALIHNRIDKAYFIDSIKRFAEHPLFYIIYRRYREYINRFLEDYNFDIKDVNDMCFFNLFDVVIKFDKKVWEKHLFDGSFEMDRSILPEFVGKAYLYLEEDNTIVGSVEYFESEDEEEGFDSSVEVLEVPYFLLKPIFINNETYYPLKRDLELLEILSERGII